MRALQQSFGKYTSSVVDLRGGVNENVSSIELAAGELIDCKNYMIAEGGYGGYKSVPGFERIDGLTIPSEYVSTVLTITGSALEITSGQTVTGTTSSATVVALEDSQLVSGTYVGGDAEVTIQCRILSSVLQDDENLTTVSGAVGVLDSALSVTGGTVTNHLGIEYARSTLVNEVPGYGPVMGVHIYNEKVYAFRKQASGTAIVDLYVEKADTSGWELIDTTAGATIPALVWDGTNDFKFTNYNFYASTGTGTSKTYSMYWADGVNPARSYDGTTVAAITNTGMGAADKPTHIFAHNFHLFLGYRLGSLQHSKIGDPDEWDGALGAGEIGLGSEITNIVDGVQSSLVIFLEEGIRVLLGNSIDDFVLETFSNTSGARNDSAKRLLGTIFFVDDRGLTTLSAVQEFGDYGANSISKNFKKTLLANLDNISTMTVSRDLNQCRIFFTGGKGIYVSFEGKELNGATFTDFPKSVLVSTQGDREGKAEIYFGSDDGYVYKMDSGTSFDGAPIITRISTSFYHYGSPRQRKAFKRATVELGGGGQDQEFYMKVNFNYNELGNPRTIWYTPEIYAALGTAVYNETRWGTMVYGSQTVTNRVPLYLQGVGTNMSYKIMSSETYREPHIIQNIITDISLMGREI